MKPMPENAFYPQQAGRHPVRPWWRTEDGGLTRADGWRVYHRVIGSSLVAQCYAPGPLQIPVGTRWPNTNALADYLAEVDKRWPLPRPRLCAGQVWMSAEGDNTVVMTQGNAQTYTAYDILLFDPVDPSLAPWSATESAG